MTRNHRNSAHADNERSREINNTNIQQAKNSKAAAIGPTKQPIKERKHTKTKERRETNEN